MSEIVSVGGAGRRLACSCSQARNRLRAVCSKSGTAKRPSATQKSSSDRYGGRIEGAERARDYEAQRAASAIAGRRVEAWEEVVQEMRGARHAGRPGGHRSLRDDRAVAGQADDAGGRNAGQPSARVLTANLGNDGDRLIRAERDICVGQLGQRHACRHDRDRSASLLPSPPEPEERAAQVFALEPRTEVLHSPV